MTTGEFALRPHPAYPPSAVHGVAVRLARRGATLHLSYRIDGAGRVDWPPVAPPARADALWQATCFELFVLLDDDGRYVEFNFSPSTRWAAYAFDDYRTGMADLPLAAPPVVARTATGADVALDLAVLPHGEPRISVTAVIVEEGGVKSFWSLAHPPGVPDFHHAACFAARLPAPDAA